MIPGAGYSKAGPVVPARLAWHGQLAAWSLCRTTQLLSRTWRCRWHDESGAFNGVKQGPLIFALWHNRLAASMVIYHRFVKHRRPAPGLAALISASKDGALLARTLQYYEVQPVRGSSSRRGRQALLELTSWIERGYHVAITPDGPRGPRYAAQEGVIALAQLTGVPIIPVTSHSHPKAVLRSWDQFEIPLPFARCDICFGEPLLVPRDASTDLRQALRKTLGERIQGLAPRSNRR